MPKARAISKEKALSKIYIVKYSSSGGGRGQILLPNVMIGKRIKLIEIK